MADNDSIQVVSRDDNENVVGNPIFVRLSDGTAAIGTTGDAIHVNIQNADVEVVQPTHDDLNANVNLQVGDADVANGNPVPVSDAGGSITIDDGGGIITVDGTVAVSSVGGTVTIADGGGSITVDAIDLDIRNLSETTDHVLVFANTAKDGTGTDYVPLVDADGHLQIDVLTMPSIDLDDASGTRVHDYQTDAAVAAAASVNHDYTSTTANGFKLKQIWFASSGASKVEVEIGQAGSGSAKYVGFIPSEGGSIPIPLPVGLIVANTEEVRIVHTNRNKSKAQDLYSTIVGDQLA